MAYSSIWRVTELVDINRHIQNVLWSEVLEGDLWERQAITFRPKTHYSKVGWLSSAGFWFAFEEDSAHFWTPLGLEKPDGKTPLKISVEINTPLSANHGRAGLLLDNCGKKILAHAGAVGGGRKGITKKNFFDYLRSSNFEIIEYDQNKEAVLVSDIYDPLSWCKISDTL